MFIHLSSPLSIPSGLLLPEHPGFLCGPDVYPTLSTRCALRISVRICLVFSVFLLHHENQITFVIKIKYNFMFSPILLWLLFVFICKLSCSLLIFFTCAIRSLKFFREYTFTLKSLNIIFKNSLYPPLFIIIAMTFSYFKIPPNYLKLSLPIACYIHSNSVICHSKLYSFFKQTKPKLVETHFQNEVCTQQVVAIQGYR